VLLLAGRGDARTRGGKSRPRRVHSERGDARFARRRAARLHQGGQAGDEVAPGWADGRGRSGQATSGRTDDEVRWAEEPRWQTRRGSGGQRCGQMQTGAELGILICFC
jgi:hypothetical protein